MNMEVVRGIMIPFLGTALGAACVFFMRDRLNAMVQRALTGFAAGVMVAASVWSLLLPAIDQCAGMGRLGLPARGGGVLGGRALPAGAGQGRPPPAPGAE